MEIGDYCAYNGSNACSFGVAIGVIAFLLCLIFLAKDVIYVVIDFTDNLLVSNKKHAQIVILYYTYIHVRV